MSKRYRIGRRGENMAEAYFKRKNYRILERNFRAGRAEVDLIVCKGALLVFVEVKTRSSLNFGFPETMLSPSQADRILGAADIYIRDINWSGAVRFDIISVVIRGPHSELCHFKDAFY